MKTKGLSSVLFIIVFIVVYIALCYVVPGWRIKLEADPATYLVESLSHMAVIKSLIALIAAYAAAAIPNVIKRAKKKKKEENR